MPIVKIHPQKIAGLWKSGFALDFHTTSSAPIGYNEFGHMQFDTIRPEIAELLYQLKYRRNQKAANDIIETATSFLKPHRHKFDLIVPVPPSTQRAVQPVMVLATGIGAALSIPVIDCISATRSTKQLKNIDDPDERKKHLDGLYAIDAAQSRGKNILLFDDLFRSGSTMNEATKVLLDEGKAASVRALTITKTRSGR